MAIEKKEIEESIKFRTLNNDTITFMETSFLDLESIENLELLSKHYRSVSRKTAWKALLKRDLTKYINKYPELQRILNNQKLSFREKYYAMITYLWRNQSAEVYVLLNLIEKPIVRNEQDPTATGFKLIDFVGVKIYSEILQQTLELARKCHDKKRLKGKTSGEIVTAFFLGEKILNEINCLIVDEVTRIYKSQSEKRLNFSRLLTRLPDTAVVQLLHEAGDVREISFDHCNLYYIPNLLYLFPALETLSLAYNHISHISDDIQKLQALETIDLISNELNALPKGLFELKNLKKLLLGNFEPLGLSCRCCDIIGKRVTTGNRFQNISPDIQKLEKLELLFMKSVGLQQLPKELGNIQSLHRIDVSHNELNDIPLEVLRLPNIGNNHISVIGNPIVKWLPLMRCQGKIQNQISMNDQIMRDFWHCSMPGKWMRKTADKLTNMLEGSKSGNIMTWAYNNRRTATVISAAAWAVAYHYYSKPK